MPSNAPKGKLYMSLISKRLVGIVASTALLSLVSAAGYAQVFSTQYGTWYTHRATWESYITNFQTANYNTRPPVSIPWTESGITAKTIGNWINAGTHLTTANLLAPVTFTFAGNAFGGNFAITGATTAILSFTVDGSQSRDLSVTGRHLGYTFLGYISNSSSDITVKVVPDTKWVSVDSFTRANGTNPADPGSNVAPEPGSFALALTGGAALIGICIRRRRNAA